MLPVVERIPSIPWTHYLSQLCHVWKSWLTYVFRRVPAPFNLRPLTDQQRKLKADEFINSIDTDAIRALASKYTGGLPCSIRCRHQGSFNVCFILDFSNGTTRLVRLPIEPAVHDVWDKVCSEVYTMQYVRDHTNIPIPRVYSYGRSRLRQNTWTRQVFMVLDHIDGKPLTKRMLRNSSEDRRRQFLGDVVDMFAQLRTLEFPRGGSLMPNATTVGIWSRLWEAVSLQEESFTPQSTMDNDMRPKIVGAFSMRKNELQIDGYTAPRFIATTAKDFFAEQYRLLQYMWKMPSHELCREEAERELFALHALSLEQVQNTFGIQNNSSGDRFCLCHPDLRADNIIVDDELRICGVIDWEFSVTVPRHLLLPPSWITGHDTGSASSKADIASEFMSVLSSRKQQSASHSQLVQDWDSQDAFRLPIAYIFLDPSDLVWLFYRYIYPGLYKKPRHEIVPRFFQLAENRQLQEGLERRLRASERYTQYLKDNNLVDDEEEPEWQQIREWNVEAKGALEQLRQWSDKMQDDLVRLDRERAMQH